MKTIIVPATPDLVPRVAWTMRQADVDELAATGETNLEAVLLRSLEVSDGDMRWSCLDLDDRAPLGVFGCAPLIPGRTTWGVAWLLTTTRIERHQRDVWEHSKRFVQRMHTRYDILTNYVDDRNVVSRRWLERLGFFPTIPVYIGEERVPFTQYVRLRDCVTRP